jgi:type IV pilus biogenesis protein PilP
MNSFRFRSKPSVNLGLALAASFLLSASAIAQTIPAPPALPPAPQVAPQVRPITNPVQPQQYAPQASAPVQQFDAPERRLALPPGANIGDAASRVRSIASEASKSLDELVGSGLAPREQFDVDALGERQRRVMLLKDQLEEAKLAKQIWQELNGKDSAEDDKNSEKVKKLQEEKEFLEKRLKEADEKSTAQAAPGADGAGDIPVVSSINGAGGSATARILIPFAGVVTATSGSTLPNGMKVVSIAPSGVIVSRNGASFTLPFGSSVPRFKTQAKNGQTAGASGQFQR